MLTSIQLKQAVRASPATACGTEQSSHQPSSSLLSHSRHWPAPCFLCACSPGGQKTPMALHFGKEIEYSSYAFPKQFAFSFNISAFMHIPIASHIQNCYSCLHQTFLGAPCAKRTAQVLSQVGQPGRCPLRMEVNRVGFCRYVCHRRDCRNALHGSNWLVEVKEFICTLLNAALGMCSSMQSSHFNFTYVPLVKIIIYGHYKSALT